MQSAGWVVDGNYAAVRDIVWSRDPQRSIIAWAWTQHQSYRERYGDAMNDDGNAHLRFVRVTDDAGLRALLDEAASAGRK